MVPFPPLIICFSAPRETGDFDDRTAVPAWLSRAHYYKEVSGGSKQEAEKDLCDSG
jgi:hypothetical protein